MGGICLVKFGWESDGGKWEDWFEWSLWNGLKWDYVGFWFELSLIFFVWLVIVYSKDVLERMCCSGVCFYFLFCDLLFMLEVVCFI